MAVSPRNMAESTPNYLTNSDLFSNHYLTDHLPDTEVWESVDEDELERVYKEISDLYERRKDSVERYNESMLEQRFIRPVFDILGIDYGVEEEVQNTRRRPDYGFFKSDAAVDRAFDRTREGGDFYEDAIAVADAKYWGRALDSQGDDRHTVENPSFQISVYLDETPAEWAVLTNGKHWRVYYARTSKRLDSYYEVNLPALLDMCNPEVEGGLEPFKHFYLFFRHEAFIDDQRGRFLNRVREESNIFAQELGEDLKDNIYDAIGVLAEGFLTNDDNDLTEDDLQDIHDASLIYLYRIIFVLYAESEGRDLLDTNNEYYRERYSLNTLKQDVAEKRDDPTYEYPTWEDDLWERLNDLFELIDKGSEAKGIPEEELYIPAYNGGLFRTDPDEDDTAEAHFLSENKVDDRHLAEVIDLLTRSEAGSNGEGLTFVDYSSLGIRHLGSIYEGLLEYNLNVADEPLVVEDGEYAPAGEGDEPAVEPGDVYLTTDSGERKATGSYYTPDYVVEYIVEDTLDPLLTDIRTELLEEHQQSFADEFAERVFDLKILDPAMGSGHFLTEVVDYLAREIIDAQQKQAERQEEADIDPSRDINWARRQVAQKCIYGVDVNSLAVELAKVSLWLRTLAAEQPLAFLDHHLRTGNSLVGSDIERIVDENGDTDDSTEGQHRQVTLGYDYQKTKREALEELMRVYQDFIAIENHERADVKEMEEKFREIEKNELRNRLVAMANVYTADGDWVDVPEDAYKRLAGALKSDEDWTKLTAENWFQKAQSVAADADFFHWKIEFPEVFYSEDGSLQGDEGGFDAVLGNPPYAQIQIFDEAEGDHYRADYDTATGNFDMYVLFVELGVELLNDYGKFGYILPNKFFRVDYGEGLRKLLSDNRQVRKVVDFGSNQVFADSATTYTTLLFLQGDEREEPFTYWNLADGSDPETLAEIDSSESWTKTAFDNESLSEAPWNFHAEEVKQTLDSADERSVPLGQLASGISRGTSTGCDDVFELEVEDEDEEVVYCSSDVTEEPVPIEKDALRKPIHSTDFEKYSYFGAGDKRVIWPYDSEYDLMEEDRLSATHPDTWDYLTEHRDTLKDRADFSKWYDYSAPRNLEVHDQAKVLIPLLTEGPSFSPYPRPQPDYILMASGGFSISLQPESDYSRDYILALINSKLLYLYLESISNVFRGGYITCTKQYFRQLPIREVSFTTPEEERQAMVDELVAQYEEYLEGGDPESRNSLVDTVQAHLSAESERDDVIHDLLARLSREMMELESQHQDLNLSLLDYLGSYSDGSRLSDVGFAQPPEGIADTILSRTTEEHPNLRVGDVEVERVSPTEIKIHMTARYKPDEEEDYETDQWGYTETEQIPALRLTDLSESQADLVEAFVPVAVGKADGFADFRETATKTNSPIDRLKALTLPDLEEVAPDIERYLRTEERAEKFQKKIDKTDELIDEIVYMLYGLSDDEIEVVDPSMD